MVWTEVVQILIDNIPFLLKDTCWLRSRRTKSQCICEVFLKVQVEDKIHENVTFLKLLGKHQFKDLYTQKNTRCVHCIT